MGKWGVSISKIQAECLSPEAANRCTGRSYVKLTKIGSHYSQVSEVGEPGVLSWKRKLRTLVSEDDVFVIAIFVERLFTEYLVGSEMVAVRELLSAGHIDSSSLSVKRELSKKGKVRASVSFRVSLQVQDEAVLSQESALRLWDSLFSRYGDLSARAESMLEVRPFTTVAWSALIAAHDAVLKNGLQHDAVSRLVRGMNKVLEQITILSGPKRGARLQWTLLNIVQQIIDCSYFIYELANYQAAFHSDSEYTRLAIDFHVRKYEDALSALGRVTQGQMSAQRAQYVVRVLTVDTSEPQTHWQDDLNDLRYASGARYDLDKKCPSGMHSEVLQEITDWITGISDHPQRLYVLGGSSSSGKADIAHTIAARFDEIGRLGSSFCFDRSQQATRNASTVFSTIARDLADLDEERRQVLCQVLQRKKSLRTTSSTREQFEKFILEPSRYLVTVGPILIVIDALDEAGDEEEREVLLSVLATKAQELPVNFRILVTARVEEDIQIAFSDKESIKYKHLPSATLPSKKLKEPVVSDGPSEETTAWDLDDIRSSFPSDLSGHVKKEGDYPVASGGYGDIYKGTFRVNGKSIDVAIKAIKTYSADDSDHSLQKTKRLRREIKVWLNLEHVNVLPLFGTTTDFGHFTAMVCPWVENGSLTSYLERRDNVLTTEERFGLLNDVAAGLQYLHSQSVVHGDLSGSNVLIHRNGRACLGDFGLSTLLIEFGGSTFPSSFEAKGTLRWAAPELFHLQTVEDQDDVPRILPTPQSDVYSFGGIMLQILTGEVPYHYYGRDEQVLYALSKGETPKRPSLALVTDHQWSFIQRCWSSVDGIDRRPSDEEIVAFANNEKVDRATPPH
ncbi:hypothetical protein HYDPIDRAFT_29675 [Hydnomerulius pinastri MD-312]|uniref:Protein kinase domain-containing protein n=1 Tax=Hydnomerulius pinastri MD-312 TaxID=994086 RepID=A0A0C9W7W7_9AGAM|nr:hypothetical protein HYDPIDRAFT_29675 [Hydnomerulius pinastri MD-312]